MSRWLIDLQTSARVVSYFVPRDESLSRIGWVMQTGEALYLACHADLMDWEAIFETLNLSTLDDLDDVAYLILDETDTLEPDILRSLVGTLLQETQHIKLILFGRRPLIDLHADATISPFYRCFIGATRIESPYETGHLVLYVETFGSGRVFANGRLVENWAGPQQIETLLVMLNLLPAATETLLMALFGSTSEEAYNKFHVSKTYINRALGQDITMLGWGAEARQQAYYLSDRILVYSDFQAYSKLTRQMLEQKTAEAFLMSSAALMRFAYRSYMSLLTQSSCLDERRLQVRHTLSQMLTQAGHYIWQKGDLAHAEALLTRALQVERLNRDALEMLLALYRQQGKLEAAAFAYQRWQAIQPPVQA